MDLDDGTLQVRRADRGEGRPDPRRSQNEGQPPKLEAHPGCHRSPEKALGAPAKGAGSLWQENGLISVSKSGTPLDRRTVTSHRFKPLLKRAGLPPVRVHDLRHTCATLLLTRNVNPKLVSEMLGHATIAITSDTYSHVLPNMRDQAAAAMEDALS